ncbi:MAG: RNA 2',3'-cyclic phosphodiesterase [Alphaproteobacteria bacterium]|nr:MAG: RNA 2',3'-cyclic phosphodiesterase [Alphaproteobacteria bacterium]
MRLFVGLSLPDTVRQHALMLMGGVKGARWQREDQLHITLRFLGEVDGAMAGDVDEALGSITMDRFSLSLAGVGVFGTLKAPRILWAGVQPEHQIRRLHDKVERAMIGLGLVPDGRKFSPHVTLARFSTSNRGRKRNPDLEVGGLGAFLQAHDGFRTPPFEVSRFVLFSSHLGHDGAIYRAEAEYPLGP